MVAGLGVLFILIGVVLIVTTYTGTTGQVLGSIFGSGASSTPMGNATLPTGTSTATEVPKPSGRP